MFGNTLGLYLLSQAKRVEPLMVRVKKGSKHAYHNIMLQEGIHLQTPIKFAKIQALVLKLAAGTSKEK